MTEDVRSETIEAVFGDCAPQASRYCDILATRGVEWGMIGPHEADRLWSRHILNSAAIASLIPNGANVVDVGSGAGLPGIPLALARPDLRMCLLDSLLRRVNFLELAVDELGLADRVTVVRARAEQCTQSYDVVVARAVAPLTRLVEWCEPMMVELMVALKGDSADAELADAAGLLDRRGLSAAVRRVGSDATGEALAVVLTRQ